MTATQKFFLKTFTHFFKIKYLHSNEEKKDDDDDDDNDDDYDYDDILALLMVTAFPRISVIFRSGKWYRSNPFLCYQCMTMPQGLGSMPIQRSFFVAGFTGRNDK